MTIPIKLYTTLGCHLCEQAHGMLNYALQNNTELSLNFSIQLVEIANNSDLLQEYGVRIPVLSVESKELGWPFSLEELNHWLVNTI